MADFIGVRCITKKEKKKVFFPFPPTVMNNGHERIGHCQNPHTRQHTHTRATTTSFPLLIESASFAAMSSSRQDRPVGGVIDEGES